MSALSWGGERLMTGAACSLENSGVWQGCRRHGLPHVGASRLSTWQEFGLSHIAQAAWLRGQRGLYHMGHVARQPCVLRGLA